MIVSFFRFQHLPIAALSLALSACHVSERWALNEAYPPSSQFASPQRSVSVPSNPVFQWTGTAGEALSSPPILPVYASHQISPELAPQRFEKPRPTLKGRFSTRSRKVTLRNGKAIAPSHAPEAVHRAVAAANRIRKLPYKWGGGHARLNDNGYDCSGATSYVLREAGLMQDQMTSRGFFNYGESGEGEWITVWVRDGHVFLTVGGLRFDTGGSSNRTGPRWKPRIRSKKGLTPRHPAGF